MAQKSLGVAYTRAMLNAYLNLIQSLLVAGAVAVAIPFIAKRAIPVILLLLVAGAVVVIFSPTGDEIGVRYWR